MMVITDDDDDDDSIEKDNYITGYPYLSLCVTFHNVFFFSTYFSFNFIYITFTGTYEPTIDLLPTSMAS